MAKERGWWILNLGEMCSDDLSSADREHIARCIVDGYMCGEIVQDGER